jgi:hypothetical protein
MSAEITVDDGFRLPRHIDDPEQGTPRPVERAERSSPGSWDEDLGRYGSDDWELPGQGERGPRCGEWYPEAVCTEHGHLELGTHSCGRRCCPDCWSIWANEASVRPTKRIQAFRHTLPDDYHRQGAHATVNPKQGDVMTEREFFNGRKKAAEIAREKGFRGFAVIPHPYRATELGKREYEKADTEHGFWVWYRNSADDLGTVDPDDLIHWSPHYHIIGVTTADMEPADESDEWVYEFHRSLESYHGTRDRDSHEDLYGVFRYLLSHTGYPAESSKQVVTWYGDLANSVFVEDATEDWQHEKPSEGVRSDIEEEIEAVAGPVDDDDSDGDREHEDDDGDPCPRDGCDGELISVFDIDAYLRQANPPPEITDKMRTARDWRLGRVEPPAGLKRPRTEADAREAWDELVAGSDRGA